MSTTRSAREVHPNVLLVIFGTAALMTALDSFIVNVALRQIGHDVGQGSLNDLIWVLNAYTIIFAALLVPAGRLGDRYGKKPVFIIGLLLFALSSLGSALSSNLWLIVGFRCLQAIGGAALVPSSLGLILTTIPAEQRRRAISIWASLASAGAAAGPAVGGLLVSISWRWIFVINVPIGLAATLAAIIFVPNVRHSLDTRIPDLLGGALLVLAIGALALGLVQGSDWGWGSSRTVIAFAVAVVGAVLFLVRSARAKSPIVDFSLYRDRTFAWANGPMFFVNIAFAMQLLGLILLMQDAWGWSALDTGLAIAPGPVMVSVGALGLRPRLPKIADGVIAASGILLMAIGGVLIATSVAQRANYAADVLPGWLMVGLGVGLWLPTVQAAGSANLPPAQSSTGSAVLQMQRWIGSTIGTAMLVVILGTSTGVGTPIHHFVHVWWYATIPAVIGAFFALGITRPAVVAAPAAAAVSH